ncbi:hypothetical protein FIBSPDRAFT_867343 [Athelia psychrophila]|uniref:AhpC-TSA-domain-containing protein n=1 Tax=Athelia psychrophila TaxID=1759441 RepID=A0A166E5A3_9AGAM|nr:hypothetical protein FIBSPDRAFT_867343 [Fibularhizoctonia sp. CBS 109695]
MDDLKAIPNDAAIFKASNLEVIDVNGVKVQLGSLFADEKTIVVLIRHFFCGSCQQYVTQLASVSPEALAAAHTRIVVIGCGDYEPIKGYLELTGYQGSIYADPSRSVYRALDVTIESLARPPAGEQKKSYMQLGFFTNLVKSTWNGPLKNPGFVGKQGNFSQLGADFVLGPGNSCIFASRMRHSEDHTEISELMQAAGVAYP